MTAAPAHGRWADGRRCRRCNPGSPRPAAAAGRRPARRQRLRRRLPRRHRHDRRRLGDAGVDASPRRRPWRRSAATSSEITDHPGHPHPPRPLHPGRRAAPAARRAASTWARGEQPRPASCCAGLRSGVPVSIAGAAAARRRPANLPNGSGAGGPRRLRPAPSGRHPDGWLGGGIRGARRAGPAGRSPRPATPAGTWCSWTGQRRLLFAGDHVLPHITPSIGFELADHGLPLRGLPGQPAADARLRRRPVAAGARCGDRQRPRPGRGTAGPPRRSGWRSVAPRCWRSAAATTAGEVAARLTWTRRTLPFADLDDFNRMLAVSETAAHLDLLAHQRLLRADAGSGDGQGPGVVLYRSSPVA